MKAMPSESIMATLYSDVVLLTSKTPFFYALVSRLNALIC